MTASEKWKEFLNLKGNSNTPCKLVVIIELIVKTFTRINVPSKILLALASFFFFFFCTCNKMKDTNIKLGDEQYEV